MTLTGTAKVANAAADLRAAAYSTNSRQNPASLISQVSAPQEQPQDTWTRTTLIPDGETTAAEMQDTWTRAASDRDVVEEQPDKGTIATSISQAPTTEAQAQDTWMRAPLAPDAKTTTANVPDTWKGVAGERDVVDEHQRKKRAIATSILEIYDRLGSFTARR